MKEVLRIMDIKSNISATLTAQKKPESGTPPAPRHRTTSPWNPYSNERPENLKENGRGKVTKKQAGWQLSTTMYLEKSSHSDSLIGIKETTKLFAEENRTRQYNQLANVFK